MWKPARNIILNIPFTQRNSGNFAMDILDRVRFTFDAALEYVSL